MGRRTKGESWNDLSDSYCEFILHEPSICIPAGTDRSGAACVVNRLKSLRLLQTFLPEHKDLATRLNILEGQWSSLTDQLLGLSLRFDGLSEVFFQKKCVDDVIAAAGPTYQI